MAISRAQWQVAAAAIAGLIVGYYVGREHIKYQLASAFSAAAGSMAAAFSGAGDSKETANTAAKENASAYASKLRIYDWAAKYHDTYSGRVAGIDFKVKNEGDRTVTRLKIVVYFQDAAGANIAEEDFTPILSGPLSSSAGGPLRPGYVWQQEPNRFLAASHVPSEWREGAATVAIREVEFE